jgi:hypothetical protein
MTFRCHVCGRAFDSDPVYVHIGAVSHPENVAHQVVAYHSLRRRFETEGCPAVGMQHVPGSARAG